MIYLSNTTEAQAVFVPVSITMPAPGALTFEMCSTVDLDTPVQAAVVDLRIHALYYDIAVALPEGITPGEYEYTLASDGTVYSRGLLVVSGGQVGKDEYNESIQYEQFEA